MTQSLKILSWNVHFPTFGKDSSFVIDTLKELGDFDVICLQEYVQGADTKTLEWLQDNDYETNYLPFASIEGISQGVMTATRKSLKATAQPTVLREDEPQRFRPFPNIRGLVTATFTIGGKKLAIHNVHLTYARKHTRDMRKREFANLRKFLSEESDKHPWVLCGDFNFVGVDSRRKYLTDHYKNFTGGLFGKTWRHRSQYSVLRANLDYFFWKGKGLEVEPKLAKFNTSDHRPMIATITL